MKLIVTLIFLSLLLFNTYQDYKSRSIYWLNIPVIIMFCAFYIYYFELFLPRATEIFVNVVIILMQLVFVVFFYSFKDGKLGTIKGKIAISDILFLLILSFVFSPSNLVFFELSLFSFSLVITLILSIGKNGKQLTTVPLAGNITLGLTLVFFTEYLMNIEIRSQVFFNLALTKLLL